MYSTLSWKTYGIVGFGLNVKIQMRVLSRGDESELKNWSQIVLTPTVLTKWEVFQEMEECSIRIRVFPG